MSHPQDGNPHLLYLALDGYAPTYWSLEFSGEGVTVDLTIADLAGNREALEAKSLTPRVTPVNNPAGNRAWRIAGLESYGTAVSPNGRYLVACAEAVDGQFVRRDTIAVDLQSGEARQVSSYLSGGTTRIAGLGRVVGWLSDTDAVLLTEREAPDDHMSPALSVLKVDVATGKQEWLGDLGRWAEGIGNIHASWLTGDHSRVFVDVTGHIWGLDLATKQRILNAAVPSPEGYSYVSPSPDGWSAAYPKYDGKNGNALVYWLNLRTGQERRVSPPDMYAQGAWWSADSRRLAFGVSPRHADGYPVLLGEDSSLLLPDAVEVVDLPTLTRQRIALPGGPVTFSRGGDFDDTVVIHVDVIGDPSQPGWRLQTRGLANLSLSAGKVSDQTPLSLPAGTYVLESRPNGEGGYIAILKPIDSSSFGPQDSLGDRVIYVASDGRMELLPGCALFTFGGPVAGDWPLLYAEGGLSWLDGRLLLSGPAATSDYFLQSVAQGWVVLMGRGEEGMVVVANPPGRHAP